MQKKKPQFNKLLKKRKAVKQGSKKNEAEFKAQHSRTKVLNEFASAINLIVRPYAKRFKPGDFYGRVQSRLRRESSDMRVLLLSELDGMEIRERYKLRELCTPPTLIIQKTKSDIEIVMTVDIHVSTDQKRTNCYYFEVILAVWGRDNGYVHSSKKTLWINPEQERPRFTFHFSKPANASDYMICLRLSLGLDNIEIDKMTTQGIMIYKTGSFTKAGSMMLAEKMKVKKERRMQIYKAKMKEEEERIMPDGYLPGSNSLLEGRVRR